MGNKTGSMNEKQSSEKSDSINLKNKVRRYLKWVTLGKCFQSLESNDKKRSEKDIGFDLAKPPDNKLKNDDVENDETTSVKEEKNSPSHNLIEQTNLLQNLVECRINYGTWDMGYNRFWFSAVKLRESGVEISSEMVARLILVGSMNPDSTQEWLIKKLHAKNTELTTLALSKVFSESAKEVESAKIMLLMPKLVK